ncbi:MAG: hypothetical protein AAFV59_14590 [Pseudomonadota bacterium]
MMNRIWTGGYAALAALGHESVPYGALIKRVPLTSHELIQNRVSK